MKDKKETFSFQVGLFCITKQAHFCWLIAEKIIVLKFTPIYFKFKDIRVLLKCLCII
ncbi:hypothetical protein HMPREF9144_1977 [Prevotella pallens ATCC 700821]|uniref:Uncharacterized protein n=1 Tax=Prevotella pallens ATCC 700821 TaxID=997353 RepID=F9DJY6_9BACT|nr:hypothetical protein HMPREF9144_1977 [Prevotella pallens ATCC 700821]